MILANRILLFVFCTLFIFCQQHEKTYTISGYTQGTTYNIKYHHFHDIDPSIVDELLHNIDLSMSTYINNSTISLLNQGEDIVLDSLIYQVLDRSIQICNETGGVFDVTIAPFVQYWGFGPNKIDENHAQYFDSSEYLVGCDKIWLTGNKLIKSDSVLIDLNGIAQGFSVDYLSNFFSSKLGINDFMIEVGGEVACVGDNLGKGWKIGIDEPTDKKRDFAFILNLNNISLATSGSYRNYYYRDSMRINHTISPKTLKPASNKLISSTILFNDCMSADAYATACMSFGFKDAKDFLNKNNIMGCLMYVENRDTLSYFSPGFASFLH